MRFTTLVDRFYLVSRRVRPRALPTAIAGILLLSSCQQIADLTTTNPVDASSVQEQAASASQSLGLLQDASSEAALASTTAPPVTTGPGGPVENAPDLTALNGTRVFDLATLSNNGRPLFSSVTTSGTITVTHSGTPVTSSPLGTTTLYTGTVLVALANVVITNANGDALRIPSGTFTYALASSCTTTDATNWVLDLRTSVAVDPPLSATVTHGGRAFNLTLGGNRTLHQVITREYGPGVNRRTVLREISGTTDGHPLSTDPVVGGHSYAAWRVAVEGVPVTWNRFASVTTMTDYTEPAASSVTVNSTEDRTFVTVLGLIVGPKTAGQWSALLGARLQAEFL